MRERPIIFSAPMVRVILEGNKTQTRRVLNPQPVSGILPHKAAAALKATTDSFGLPAQSAGGWTWKGTRHMPWPSGILQRCPYGAPGDRLWVRETFAQWKTHELFGSRVISVTAFRAGRQVLTPPSWPATTFDEWDQSWSDSFDCKPADVPWRPSIFMPRALSRITLEVTSVRVERVQDISVDDARDEGCEHPLKGAELEGVPGDYVADERTSFARLWNTINAKRGFGWDVNPWVWAIEFRRLPA